jgi:hypothetical protein
VFDPDRIDPERADQPAARALDADLHFADRLDERHGAAQSSLGGDEPGCGEQYDHEQRRDSRERPLDRPRKLPGHVRTPG